MNGLTFDEALHEYRYDGKVVPSVTQVLRPLGNFDAVPADIMAAAQAFGTAVHKACELDDAGLLDEDKLDPALLPYLEAWRQFSADNDVEWLMVEGRVWHPTHGYAGTLDRYGVVKGKLAVVDIKSSAILYPPTGPQLAAYKNAITNVPPTTRRLAVQLKDDCSYVLKEYTDRDDWSVFLSLLTLKQWCRRHSITSQFSQEQS